MLPPLHDIAQALLLFFSLLMIFYIIMDATRD